MKNIIVIILSIVMVAISNPILGQSKSMDEFTVQVDGLGCPFCAYGLEKKFKEFKGIKKVKIEMETGIMDFKYPSEKALTIEQIEKKVEKAGYTPVSVSIKRADGTVEATKTKTEVAIDGELRTIEFFVAGNCDMCRARIEKAAKTVGGVQEAAWNKETKQLTIKVGGTTTKMDVEKAIAKSGHDTNTAKADSKKYESLPGCCHYERVQ